MRRVRLTIDGFLAYDTQVSIAYSSGEITAITGPNGAGKTSIPDAIAWVRFGELRVRGDGDSIINDGCMQAHVIEELVDDVTGFRWKFDRRKKRGKTQVLSVFSFNNATGQWERYGTKLIGDNQKIINDLVGLTPAAFYSLSVFESRSGNRGIRLVSAKAEERIGILTSLKKNLSLWPGLNKKVIAAARETKRELSSIEDVLAATVNDQQSAQDALAGLHEQVEAGDSAEKIDADLAEAQSALAASVDQDSQQAIEVARANRDRVAAQTKEASGEVGRKIGAAERDLGDIRNAAEHVKELTDEIAEIDENTVDAKEQQKKAKAALGRLDAKLDGIQGESSSVGEKIAALAAGRETLEDRLEDLKERIRAAEDSEGACVVCGSEISKEKSQEIIDGLTSQLSEAERDVDDAEDETKQAKANRNSLAAEIKRTRSSIDAANKQIDSADDLVRSLAEDRKDAVKELERSQEILDCAEVDEDDLTEQIETLRAQRTKIDTEGEERVAKYNEEIAQIKEDMPRAKDIRAYENTIERLKRQRDNLISVRSKISQLEEQIDTRAGTVTDLRSDSAEVAAHLNDLEVLREATGQRGIPFLMLSDMLTNIEAKADEFLGFINGDHRRMSVDLVQDYESNRPTLDIMVSFDDGSTRPVEALSNGEVTRVSLALMFALAYTVNLSRPGTVSDIFLDEPLAAVDDMGVDGVLNALRHAINKGVVDSVMIVAHDRTIIDACDVEVSVADIWDSADIDSDEEAGEVA